MTIQLKPEQEKFIQAQVASAATRKSEVRSQKSEVLVGKALKIL